MIKYISGDVTETESILIAHGVNAQGVMASGVAKAIRAKFPYAYDTYIEVYRQGHLHLGNVVYADAEFPEMWKRTAPTIANCVTQEFYGRNGVYIDYGAIKSCMANLNEFCHRNNIDQISMPMIGAGLGGGDWDAIALIINEEIKDDITVLVYILR